MFHGNVNSNNFDIAKVKYVRLQVDDLSDLLLEVTQIELNKYLKDLQMRTVDS